MKTLVLGASHKPGRYANIAMHLLREHGHEVVPVGRRARSFEDWEIREGKPAVEGVDTVTMYMSAANQSEFEDYILSLKPRRVIFNPGAENPTLAQKLENAGVETEIACTLVLLRTGQF